jgi:cysteine-rich repeat protein
MLDCGPCPRCGDGHIDAGEQCDDGNTSGGDGCEANCEVSVFCPAIPSAPTTGLAPGTATGSFTLNVPINRTITWVQAAFVPVPNTTSFQLILSNDPQLCHTLVNRKQYLETPCDDLCSVCASCSRNNVGQYAYLTARFEQSMPAGSTVSDMPFVDLHSNVVGFGLRMAVDDAITPASQALTGQVELCSSKYGATGTARFHATLCAGGLPINN